MAGFVRLLVVLSLPSRVPYLIAKVEHILQAMTGNPDVPNPPVSLAVVRAHLDELVTAQALAGTRALGAAAARDTRKRVVLSDVDLLRAYVQAAADACPERAHAIIVGCGMGVRRFYRPQKQVFEAWCTHPAGTVGLCAPSAGRQAAYHWEWSADGQTWHPLPLTLVADTTVSGLAPRATYCFRHRVTTRESDGVWSEPISLFVV